MFEELLPHLRNAILIPAVAMLYILVPKRLSPVPESAILGVVFGLGACLAMLDPLRLRPGVFVDCRATMVLLSGLFGGPAAGMISTLIAAGMRIYLGGLGRVPGSVSVGIAGSIGIALYLALRRSRRPVTFSDILVLAAVSPLTFAAIFFAPWEIAINSLAGTFITTSILRALGVIFLGALLLQERRRVAAEDRIREMAGADELSGLANRRAFYQALNSAVDEHRMRRVDFAVVITDLDYFKSINDRYGHQAGDDVIKKVAEVLRATIRDGDVAARIGGEEFAVLLTGTNREGAMLVSDRIRASIAGSSITVGTETVPFPASMGLAASTRADRPADAMMSAADTALYLAKNGGRNRVVTEDAAEEPT